MMWNEHENLLYDIFKSKWKELAQSLISQTIKLNLSKKVAVRLGFECPITVNHFFSQMIEPKVEKTKPKEKAQEATNQTKDWLQKIEETKKVAMEKAEKELSALMKKTGQSTY